MDTDDIVEFVRDNLCEECCRGRGRCEPSMEAECYAFTDEVERIKEDDDDRQESHV